MYPAQTSFFPIHIALARFLESQGWQAVFVNYPYWYLGTTPFRYLTGPVLPIFLAAVHRLLPGLNLFEIFLGLICITFPFGAVGVYLLVKEMNGGRSSALLATVFYFFGLIIPFLFRFSDGLYLIAFSFLPYILLLYLRLLQQWQRKTAICLIFSITGLILLDISLVPSLIFGMTAVFLAETGWKRAGEKLKKSLWLIVYSLLLATFWYTPGYWLTLLTAPSLAGKTLLSVVISLPRLLAIALAIFLAIFSVRFFKKRNLFRDFCFFWLFIFGFLTLARFMADPDFWLDWSAYGIELQMGMGMGLSLILSKIKEKTRRILMSLVLISLLIASWLLLVENNVINTFQKEINQSVEYRIGEKLTEIMKPGEKVFLSGTTAFWLNAFFDIPQVRGGVDQAAVHPTWDKAAWEIREGTKVELSEKWLRELGVKYLVVHDETSKEFYHDFAYPEKFEQGNFEKVFQDEGDSIYKVINPR